MGLLSVSIWIKKTLFGEVKKEKVTTNYLDIVITNCLLKVVCVFNANKLL